MSRAALRRIDWIEPIAVFGLIMAYIWQLRYSHHGLWVPILALIVASHIWRRESIERLGFHRANLRECLESYGPMIAFVGLAMFAAGLVLQTNRPMALVDGFLAWAVYVAWGTFQQYLLNGYFLNRFMGVMPGRSAAVASAALFSSAHLPNWFLMIVTLILG